MITGKEKLSEAMIKVYMMEKGMKEFYEKASRKAASEDAQRAFEQLARWEDEHMRYLQSLYQGLGDERETASFEEFKARTPGQGVEDAIPLSALEHDIGMYSFMDDHGALSVALEIKTKAFNLYEKFSESAEDSNTRTFMKEMTKREQKHIEYLEGLRTGKK